MSTREGRLGVGCPDTAAMGLLAAQQTQGRVHRTQDSVWVGVRGQGCLEPGVPDSELWAPWLPRLRALPGSRPGTCSGLCSALGRCLPAAPFSRGGLGSRCWARGQGGVGGGAGLASAPVWSDPEASTLSSPGASGSPAVGPLLTLPGPGICWGGVRAPTTAQGVLGAKTGPDLP